MRLKFPFPVLKFPRNFSASLHLRRRWETRIRSTENEKSQKINFASFVATRTKNSFNLSVTHHRSKRFQNDDFRWRNFSGFRYWNHLSLVDWCWWVVSLLSASKFCHHKSIIRALRDFSCWRFQLISIFQIKLFFYDERTRTWIIIKLN